MAIPTYYYYSGLLCGGGIQVLFRSTDPNLSDNCAVAKAYYDGTVQCFDNIVPSSIPNNASAEIIANLQLISEVFQKIEEETAEMAELIFDYLIKLLIINILNYC